MLWFKVGDIVHIKKNITLCGKRFAYNTGFKIVEVNYKRESYLCEIPIKSEIREVELSQTEFVSPKIWEKTEVLDRKLKELGL